MIGIKAIYLIATALLTSAASTVDEVTTITETNYITPECFKQAYETALVGQAPGLTEGIKVVFVNADNEEVDFDAAPTVTSQTPNDDHRTYLTTSDIEYTVSSGSTFYTTTGPMVLTTVGKKATKSDPEKLTIYQYETETENSEVFTQITKKAKTTTETVFVATVTPSTTYEQSIETQTITSTIENPVMTGLAVPRSSSRTRTIKVPDSTSIVVKAVESETSDVESSEYLQSSDDLSNVVSTVDNIAQQPTDTFYTSSGGPANATSTIDLRIGSSLSSQLLPTRAAAVANQYANASSSEIYSSEYYSSEMVSIVEGESSSTQGSSSIPSSSAGISLILLSSVLSSSRSSSSSAPSSSASSSSASSSSASRSSIAAVATGVSRLPSTGSGDLFEPISNESPLSVFKREELPLEIPEGTSNDIPYETNKFYANLFLDSQTSMIWSYPYGLYWKTQDYYGLGIQHTDKNNRVFGDDSTHTDGKTFFFNPTNNAELLISAESLTEDNNKMSVSDMKSMSVTVKLSGSDSADTDYVEIPIVQGMGFVTAIYHGDMVAELNTLYGVSSLKKESSSALAENVLKYRVTLFNDYEYLVYVTLPEQDDDFELQADDSFHILASKSVDGLIIQMAYAPENGDHDGYYDEAAGMYPVSAEVSGSASGGSASYKFSYKTEGESSSGSTMIFALPHHVESFDSSTDGSKTPIKLTSTTKGDMVGLLSNEIGLIEELNSDIGFLPWSPQLSGDLSYDSDKLKKLAETAQEELNVDIKLTVANMNSNYFSGKVIDKYANILLVIHDIIGDKDFAEEILEDLKDAFEVFTSNEQYYPLMYDTKFGGITSTASQDGDTGADYGSAYYNDHHFHYGYFVHAAAVVGHVDKELGGSWAEDNKDWVNNLIRDVANPSEEDTYFPVSRMFDWFAGHSWAGGLFVAGDGRNEESSSEDYHFTYGMKLWGNVIEDESMEGRGDLMLAVQKRSMNKYFYFSDDNDVIPKEMIGNKVSGIFFDNKIAYTTYFGDAEQFPEYVHGIHMIPMTAAAAMIRGTEYVQQEWDQVIDQFIGDLEGGWAGIIRLNQALINPERSYEYFSEIESTSLDNGQSLTWSLAFSGGLSS